MTFTCISSPLRLLLLLLFLPLSFPHLQCPSPSFCDQLTSSLVSSSLIYTKVGSLKLPTRWDLTVHGAYTLTFSCNILSGYYAVSMSPRVGGSWSSFGTFSVMSPESDLSITLTLKGLDAMTYYKIRCRCKNEIGTVRSMYFVKYLYLFWKFTKHLKTFLCL